MKRTFVAVIIVFAFIFLAASPARAKDRITISKYACFDLEGNKRWEASRTLMPAGKKGLFLLKEAGSGVYSGFDGPVKWKTETEFSDDGSVITPIRMTKTFRSEDDTILFEGSQEFDAKNRWVTCAKRWPASGKEVKKTLRYRGEVVNDCLLGLYVKRFLENGDMKKIFYLVSNDPAMYKISAKVKKKEDVTINGVTRTAYKIDLDPRAGIFGIFAPETCVWHLAKPDHAWLKYRGAEDTIDSTVVRMETLDII